MTKRWQSLLSWFTIFHLLSLILLRLLSRFSRVQLYATPETAAHQAPPSLGFSRQEHWSGLPFPPPMRESEKWKWSLSVVDCSLPGSSVHGIFQARVLEWGAIAFSNFNPTWPLNKRLNYLPWPSLTLTIRLNYLPNPRKVEI